MLASKFLTTNYLLQNKHLSNRKNYCVEKSVSLCHWWKFIYTKEVISAFQNVIFRKDYLWKFKYVSSNLPPARGSKSATGINGKEHKLSFHPQFIYEGFTSLPVTTKSFSINILALCHAMMLVLIFHFLSS